MNIPRLSALLPAVFLCVSLSAPAQTASAPQLKALTNGIELSSGTTILQVTALRDDVLRVRAGHSGQLPEDASWAVLPEARTSTVTVTPAPTGFETKALRVTFTPDLRLTIADLNGTILQQDARPIEWRGASFTIDKKSFPDSHFFGLGDKPGPLDRAGRSFVMWNTDSFGWQESTDPIYKSIPFFIDYRAARALGVLFDNTFRTFFDFGHQSTTDYTFSAPDGPVDYYLLYGPDPKKVVETYAWLTGPTPLPPLWSLGFQQSRYSYFTDTELTGIADRLRADHLPADALYLDIDYQDKNRPFTVNTQNFPNLAKMVHDLAEKHFHTVLITDLHIPDLPGYAPYDTGKAGDHFVKNPDGTTYVGPVWPGPSVFPDFTQDSSREWWGTLYKDFIHDGVAGFWNDMNEPAVFTYPSKTMPDTVQHRIDGTGFQPRTATHLEIHNVFGMQNSRATYEGLLKLAPDQRPFVLTRASYAGGQRYASTWTGDNSSTWNHLRMTTPQLLNLGLSGFSMSGADVGGFAGSPPPDLLTKWLQLAAFQPIYRDHAVKGSRPHEPWADGPEQEAIRRRFIEERYRLIPYLYTTAEETSRNGLPIMRPLFLEFPNATTDGHPIDLDAGSEFLFGPDLLVAPNPSPEEVAPYEVHLPPGVWYDYWTGERIDRSEKIAARDLEQPGSPQAKPQTETQPKPETKAIPGIVTAAHPLMITPTLADLPVYVRAGSIIPISPLTQSTEEPPNGPLTLRVYAGNNCHGTLYQDDGKSFAFRTGQYLRMNFTCELRPDGSLTVHIAAPEGSFNPWWHELRIETLGWNSTTHELTSATTKTKLQQSNKSPNSPWTATIPQPTTATDLTLK